MERYWISSETHARGPDRGRVVISKALDASLIAAVLWLTVSVLRPGAWNIRYALVAVIAGIVFVTLGDLGALYRPRRGESLGRRLRQILFIWGQTAFVFVLLAYSFKVSEEFSRLSVISWFLSTPLILSGWRALANRVMSRYVVTHGAKRKVAIWGSGELADQVAETVARSPWLGLRLVEYIEERPGADLDGTPGDVTLSAQTVPERIEWGARQGDFDILYIALPTSARDRITDVLARLSDTTVSAYMVPDYFTTSLYHGTWSNLEGIPLISVFDTPFWGEAAWVKRAEDIVLSSLILAIVALPMVAIVVAVKLSSPGPILFKQRRYGIEGKEISVWKFRTMCVCEDGAQMAQAQRNDPRVTAVGAFLRRTSLDELPQFFNVLMGDMSIVGPRPHAVAHNEYYRKQVLGYMLRHKVKPGITGWAQINGSRGETDEIDKMRKRVEYDLWYIRNWSLWLDLKIIFLSIPRGFISKNAY